MNELHDSAAVTPRRNSILEGRWSLWLLVFGFWTLVGLIIASLSHGRMTAIDQPSNLLKWIVDALLSCYCWAAFTPLIAWLGRRLSIDSRRWLTHLILLVLAGAAITVAQTAFRCLESMVVMGEPLSEYLQVLKPELFWRGPWNFLIFAGILGVSYARDYQLRWRERTIAAGRLESELAKAQMNALRAQIQPHFLFNTLNSILVLIQRNRLPEAQATINRLSDLIRYILNRGSELVTVGEEMEIVRGFVEIEQMRLGDRLKVSMTADPAAGALRIPALVIQPLVENAIRHGLAPKEAGGTVEIRIGISDHCLRMSVKDDGVGIDTANTTSENVGIGNTRARLGHLYGECCRMQITPVPSGGTLAEITIPIDLLEATN